MDADANVFNIGRVKKMTTPNHLESNSKRLWTRTRIERKPMWGTTPSLRFQNEGGHGQIFR